MSCVVYTCHNVVPLDQGKEERGTIDLSVFVRQLRWLKRLGIRFIPMNDLRAWLQGRKSIPKRSAVLTFDDALISISEHVFTYIEQQAIPITIFVVAGLIGRESNFSKHRSGQPRRHLNLEQLKTLIKSGLVEVGAHGYHHLDLTTIDDDKLWTELYRAKDTLESSLSVEVNYFAYPWGNTTRAVTRRVKAAGYQLAFTTQKKKLASNNIDFFRIPRVNWGRRATLFKLSKYHLIPGMRSID